MRRLLNDFEQGVGAIAIQVLSAIDDGDPPAPEGRGQLEDLQPLPHRFDRDLAGEPLCRPLPLAADEREIGMGEPGEQPGRGMVWLDVKVTRLAHGLRRRVGVGEHETGEPPGERRLADSLPAADEPRVRQTPFAIGRQHFRFGALMADERIDMAGMRRSGQRVRFGKVVALAFFRARRAHGRNCDGRVLERRPPTDLVLRSRAEARRLEARLQLSTPSAPAGASSEAAPRRLRTRWEELLMRA